MSERRTVGKQAVVAVVARGRPWNNLRRFEATGASFKWAHVEGPPWQRATSTTSGVDIYQIWSNGLIGRCYRCFIAHAAYISYEYTGNVDGVAGRR